MAEGAKIKILGQFNTLPPAAQREVVDFITFLRNRYKSEPTKKKAKMLKLKNEAFVGMWKDRDDMQDSALWVRKIRKQEWSN